MALKLEYLTYFICLPIQSYAVWQWLFLLYLRSLFVSPKELFLEQDVLKNYSISTTQSSFQLVSPFHVQILMFEKVARLLFSDSLLHSTFILHSQSISFPHFYFFVLIVCETTQNSCLVKILRQLKGISPIHNFIDQILKLDALT